ncbi:MAG: hypothetical protein H0V76_05865 [Blastocatellia bacterium]|nr:hypothetical protein [Blastocatellia bacterium]
MKNLIVLAGVCLIGTAGAVQSQKPSAKQPPPPRAISSNTKVFESEAGGFKIAFPAAPKFEKSPIESSYGKTEMLIYSLPTGLASYAVTIIDFPTDMTDRYDLNVRFDHMRNVQSDAMQGRVISDAELNFGSRYGRDSVIEGAKTTMSMRSIVAGPRLFVISVETPGKLTHQSGALLEGNSGRIKRFFDSFEITKEPVAAQKRVELPADFGVTFKDHAFRSAFFGSSMNLPAGWKVVDEGFVGEIFELGKERVAESHTKLATQLTPENVRMLGIVSKQLPTEGISDASIMFLAERVPFPNFKPKYVGDTYVTHYLSEEEEVLQPSIEIKIGGVEFAWVETFDHATESYKRLFISNQKGIAFQVALVYKDPDDLEIMMRLLNSIRFVSN